MRTLVIGARGQLGTEVVRLASLKDKTTEAGSGFGCLERIEDPFFDFFKDNKFDLVVNCAAFHNVPECEADPARALEVNAFAHRRLLEACSRQARVVYVSTNYVFSEPYFKRSFSVRNPRTVYGMSKALGEYFTEEAKQTVVRVAHLYGPRSPRSKGPNLVRKMVAALLSDEKEARYADYTLLSLTNATDAARAILDSFKMDPGTYNFCNTEFVSCKELLEHLSEFLKIKKDLVPYKTQQFGSPLTPASEFDAINRPALQAVDAFLRKEGVV